MLRVRGGLQDGKRRGPGRALVEGAHRGACGGVSRHDPLRSAHHVPAVRERPLRVGLPHRCQLSRRGRRRAGGQGEVHRLQVLHDGLPLRRALVERGREVRREVHPVRAPHVSRQASCLREELCGRRSFLRRLGRPELRRVQGAGEVRCSRDPHSAGRG